MANTKKTAAAKSAEKTVEIETPVEVKAFNGRMSLLDISKIVNTVVDSVFTERNGNIEFSAEYYEVLLAYLKVGAFYPHTGVLENSLDLFFIDYIDGKYYRELNELKDSRLAQYIDNAVKQKIEARMRQVENPLIDSMKKFVDVATVLAQKYVDDIDNVGASDIKGFFQSFANFTKNTNTKTVTDAVIKLHQAEDEKNTKRVDGKISLTPKKSRTKKTAE